MDSIQGIYNGEGNGAGVLSFMKGWYGILHIADSCFLPLAVRLNLFL